MANKFKPVLQEGIDKKVKHNNINNKYFFIKIFLPKY